MLTACPRSAARWARLDAVIGVATVLLAVSGGLAVPAQAARAGAPALGRTRAAVTVRVDQRPHARRGAARGASSQLASLRHAVLAALAGSTASHVALRADVAGLGDLSLAPTTTSRPASNEKLLTAEAALQVLGPDFRWVTRVEATGRLSHGVLTGDLVLVGSGDPLLETHQINELAVATYRAGIRQVDGEVIAAQGLYTPRTSAPGWKPDFVPDDVGPINSVALNENEGESDPAYVADPALHNADVLLTALGEEGIKVHHATTVTSWVADTRPVASVTSAPLSAVLADMLTHSDDFIAEMLLDQLAVARTGHGSRAAGVAEVEAALEALHTPAGRVEDGSGLSYDDAESPDELVELLERITTTSTAHDLEVGLPVSCETGTLQERLCGSGLTGRIHAKTGTLDGVRTLSGYTTTRSGRAVTFSIMLQGITSMTTAQQHIDAATAVLARYDH